MSDGATFGGLYHRGAQVGPAGDRLFALMEEVKTIEISLVKYVTRPPCTQNKPHTNQEH